MFYTLVPNAATLAGFVTCVHVLANGLSGRAGSPAWYAVLAAAVATGTAVAAIAAVYAYLYGRDLVGWARRKRGARRLRRQKSAADCERQRLLSGGEEETAYSG